MKKQIFLGAALFVLGLGACSATEANTITTSKIGTNTEISASSTGFSWSITRGRLCLFRGQTCTIRIEITFQQGLQLLANFDVLDSSYDGETMEEWQFQVMENGQLVTYTVPTQTLNWTGQGFLMNYQ